MAGSTEGSQQGTQKQEQQQVPAQAPTEGWDGGASWAKSMADSKTAEADRADVGQGANAQGRGRPTSTASDATVTRRVRADGNTQQPARSRRARQNQQPAQQQGPAQGQQAFQVQQPNRNQQASQPHHGLQNQQRAQQQGPAQGQQAFQLQQPNRMPQASQPHQVPHDQLFELDFYLPQGQWAAQPRPPTSNPPPVAAAQNQFALNLTLSPGQWEMQAQQPDQHANGFFHHHPSQTSQSQRPGHPAQHQLAPQPQQQPAQYARLAQYHQEMQLRRQAMQQREMAYQQAAQQQAAQQQAAQQQAAQQQAAQQQAEEAARIAALVEAYFPTTDQHAPQIEFSAQLQASAGLSQAAQGQQPPQFQGSTGLPQPPSGQAPVGQDLAAFDDPFESRHAAQPHAHPQNGPRGQQLPATGPARLQAPVRPGLMRPLSFEVFNAALEVYRRQSPPPPAFANGELRVRSPEGRRYITNLQEENRQLRHALARILQDCARLS